MRRIPRSREMKEVGIMLRAARKDAGISQAELSERTGISQGDISRMECGCANPTVETLQRIADGTGERLQIIVGNRHIIPQITNEDVDICGNAPDRSHACS